MGYGWEGETVRLVPLDKERHMENALLWLNDPTVTEWTLTGDFPITRLAEEDFFNRMTSQTGTHPTDIVFGIETLAGEHIGLSGIHRIEWRHGVAVTGTTIGSVHRGKGYGSDAARTRLRYAFDVLGLRMLMSEVMADNTASLRMLQKAGYTEVGRIPRRYWKRGAYRDAIIIFVERPA
ncbi:MAG TPA: GNAT family N-acetyltransferase [Pyrinomonadaceae bacterium]|jgi:RimJ/RimL family protein N-acetyltransferase|nr:GNAT family N-acetyltransferase [Pyrinomonadaceae bacterium]